MSYIINVFLLFRTTHFGDRSSDSIVNILREKQSGFEKDGGRIEISENPFAIAIVTPIMKRAHCCSFSKNIVFVDSSGSCDQGNSSVTFFFGSSKIGGIPLGVIIHKHQTKNDYFHAFTLLKKCLGNIAFDGQLYPSVIMTDDSAAERQALKAAFPSARLLLCAFHICQALWRWLWESKHGIDKADRQSKMLHFRSILFSQNETEALKSMDELCKDKNVQFAKHMTLLKNRMQEWAVCYRKHLFIHGHNTNNVIESSIRIFKDVVLERCKAFNAAALVDFIFKVLEDYHKRRLIKFATYRVTKPILHYKSFLEKAKNLKVTKVNDNSYLVTSSSNVGIEYMVQVNNGYEHCECPAGSGGSFCKHICAIHYNGFIIENIPILSTEDRITLGNLAVGNNFDPSFMTPMENIDDATTSMLQKSNELDYSASTTTNLHIVTTENPDPFSSSDQNESDIQNKVTLEIDQLQVNMNRITSLAQNNVNLMVLKNLRQFNKLLGTINTVSDFPDIFFNRLRRGKLIGTQPTSKARRTRKITSGAKRIQSGRPSNMENCINKKRKRKFVVLELTSLTMCHIPRVTNFINCNSWQYT